MSGAPDLCPMLMSDAPIICPVHVSRLRESAPDTEVMSGASHRTMSGA
jgi:hypothetical protein